MPAYNSIIIAVVFNIMHIAMVLQKGTVQLQKSANTHLVYHVEQCIAVSSYKSSSDIGTEKCTQDVELL